MKQLIIVGILSLFTLSPSKQTVCNGAKGDPEVHVKDKNAAISYDQEIVYNDPAFANSIMGKNGTMNCSDIHIRKNLIAMRYGHRKDLVLLFAFEYDKNGKLKRIYRHFDRLQDGDNILMQFSDSGDVLVKYGRNKDINKRYSFNFASKSFVASAPNRVHQTGIDSYYSANTPVGTQVVFKR